MASLQQLFVMSTDLETSREFYEDGLGLEPREASDGSVAYETGSCELKLEADFDPAELEAFNLSPPPAEDRGAGAVIVIQVDDSLEATYDRLRDVLADVPGERLIEPREVPWGGEMFLVRDPDGYVLELRPPEN